MRVEPLAPYRLEGAIEGLPVLAETVTPATFDVVAPAADTITASDGNVGLATAEIPFHFAATGVSAVEIRTMDETGVTRQRQDVDVPSGTLVFVRAPQVSRVGFFAYNQDSADWLVRSTPKGNVQGAFGGFGGAIVELRYLYIP